MNLTEEDFDCRYAKFFEWVADNQLRKFRIIRRDGTIKEILFSEMLENQKIVKRILEAKKQMHTGFDLNSKNVLDAKQTQAMLLEFIEKILGNITEDYQ